MSATSHPTVDSVPMDVTIRGDLPSGTGRYAREKVTRLLQRTVQPVLYARVRLTRLPDPALRHPVLAQVNLDVNGRLVRAQIAASTGREAVDLLVDRLRRQLPALAQHWEARRGHHPVAQPPDLPAHPTDQPRPAQERRVVRHKSYTPPRISADEAAWEMNELDYRFHLFTDEATGTDAVVYRGGPTGYRLARLPGAAPWLALTRVPLTLSPHPAPLLTVAEAVVRLEETGWPFVFYADRDSGRGRVLYHRYDGDYGLITPVV